MYSFDLLSIAHYSALLTYSELNEGPNSIEPDSSNYAPLSVYNSTISNVLQISESFMYMGAHLQGFPGTLI